MTKTVRFGRMALLLAGLLAVSGSFGLHPEPGHAPSRPASGHEWVALDGAGDSGSHVCLACLAHRSVPLPRLAAVVMVRRPAVAVVSPAAPSLSERLESHPNDGRAPPSLG